MGIEASPRKHSTMKKVSSRALLNSRPFSALRDNLGGSGRGSIED
jgi:hypothetical protein